AANADIHSEIPSMPFTWRIAQVRITLENNPAGPIPRFDIAIIQGTLTALQVPHRPEPGLKSEISARIRVVFRCPRHRRAGRSISIVISGSAVVTSAGQRARGRMSDLSSVGRNTARPQIAQVDGK